MSKVVSNSSDWIADFSLAHRLPESYRLTAERYFLPLAQQLVQLHANSGPLLVGINGCQGSGKSTLSQFLVAALAQVNVSAVALSLDDFYLTHAERQALAREIHPLLATRGVPGTHDLDLMSTTLSSLMADQETEPRTIVVPCFDKATDDRTETAQWFTVALPVDVVIWEGWCLGVPPQPDDRLATPINALEMNEDPGGQWRAFVNDALTAYQSLFDAVDFWVMLKAPNFDSVYQWRLEQEQKLAEVASNPSALMSAEQLSRFIRFYQRLTEWGFESVPTRCDWLFTLDANRRIQSFNSSRTFDSSRKEVRV